MPGPLCARPCLPGKADRKVDQARIERQHRLHAIAHGGQHAGAVILDQHVNFGDQLFEDRARLFVAWIDLQAALVAGVAGAGTAAQGGGLIVILAEHGGLFGQLARVLDADHIGAHVGSHPTGIGSRQKAAEIDDGETGERTHAGASLWAERSAAGPSIKAVIAASVAAASSPSRLKLSVVSCSTG
jgi:hypothetical protein